MISPGAQAYEDNLRARAEAWVADATVDDQRQELDVFFAASTTEPRGVGYTRTELAGVPAQWVEPAGAATDRVLLFVHGGGYVFCSIESHAKLVGHLCKAIGCRGLNLGYRLAPEHPHPAAIEDSTATYRALLEEGIEPQHLAIAGDSAGGNLTLATLLKLRDDGQPLPAAAVTMSPGVEWEGLGESMSTNAGTDLMIQREAVTGLGEIFLNGHDRRDPLVAPLYGSYDGLPSLYIQVGGAETLLDDSTRLAAKAARAGVEVRLDVFPHMQHVFQMAAGNMPEADDAITRIGNWLRPRLDL